MESNLDALQILPEEATEGLRCGEDYTCDWTNNTPACRRVMSTL
ncbi:hypothetical protein ACFC1R_21590 [Kitasatospora sp. NPDC056138]